MKKVMAMLVLSVVLLLAACGGGETPAPTATANPVPEATAQPEATDEASLNGTAATALKLEIVG